MRLELTGVPWRARACCWRRLTPTPRVEERLLMEEDLRDSPAMTLGFFLLTTDFVFVLLNAVLWARSLVNG